MRQRVYPARRDPKAVPMHPGRLLRSVMPALRRPMAEIAEALGVSRPHIYKVLHEKKPVSVRMARRLGKLCGNRPSIWLALQERYDQHLSRPAAGR